MKQYQHLQKLCFLLMVASLLFAGKSRAHGNSDLYPVSLDQRIEKSALIIEGTVISNYGFYNPSRTNIYTSNLVRVHRVLKGSLAANEIEIITEGGTVGLELHLLSSTLQLAPGQTGIIFCEPHNISPSGRNIPSYMVYTSLQGFIEYDPTNRMAYEPFNEYADINEAINSVKAKTGTDISVSNNPAMQSGRAARKTTATPAITSFSPTTVTAGTGAVLTITGTNFGTSRGSGYVEFKNANNGGSGWVQPISSDYVSWTDTQIQVRVPSWTTTGGTPAGTGQIRVTNSDPATVTSASNLTVTYACINVEIASTTVLPHFISKNGAGGYDFQMYTGFAANTAAVAALTRAMNTWTCATNMRWVFGSNTSTNSAGNDGVNVVRYDVGTELPGGVLGRTTTYYSGYLCGGTTYVATVEGIDQVYDDGTSWEYGPSAPTTGYDFESVVLHELGHAHGLGHVIDLFGVMNYATSAGFSNRVLNTNTDVSGGVYIYNRSSTSNPCGFSKVTSLSCPYYFRTAGSGNWNSAATWETSNDNSYWISSAVLPAGDDGLATTIQNGHTVTVTADATIDELTINSGGTMEVNPGVAITVNDGTGTDLTIASGGTLTLKSSASGDARIAASTGSISGNVTVEKYIPAKRAFRFMAHPFSSSMALSQLTDDIDITGSGGTSNGFTATQTNAPSAFYWDASAADNSTAGNNPGWSAFTSASASNWDQYELLRVLVRGTKGQGLTGGSYTPSVNTVAMNGAVNTGTQVITLTKGNNSDYVACGNPFPSGVQMQNVSRGGNVGSNYYVWDATSGAAGAYITNPWGMSYVLPAYSAFFTTVSANTNNTLTFEEADKASGSPALFKGTANDGWVELTISDSNTKWDRLLIGLDATGLDIQDDLDGIKLYNPGLDFFTLSSDSARLAVDVRPYNRGTEIPLGLTAYNRYNRYVMRTGMFGVAANEKLYLHDRYLNKTEELVPGFEYWFDVTTDSNSQGNNRFVINMQPDEPGIAEVLQHPAVRLAPNPARNEVKISFDKLDGPAMIRLLSVTGQTVYSKEVNSAAGIVIVPLHGFPAGIYIAELQSSNARFTEKLIKQ